MDELVEEALHACAAERDLVADDVAGAGFEVGDRFLGRARSRMLAGDALEAVLDELKALFVLVDLVVEIVFQLLIKDEEITFDLFLVL